MDIMYMLERNTHFFQDLGSITPSAGHVFAWPNVYRHRVSPFLGRLLDPTKPGHRKIFADPSVEPIPSATDVPQQHYWTLDALVDARTDLNSLLSCLSLDLLG
ncbi:hypothetical protein B0H14DRAFT_2796190 [Mycena olivaceomarginata]|nr:hypothetical protein B0H14DRAFT_2796190 [Mycena olivaceomarginata]